MAEEQYTKAQLMRRNKAELLALASEIEFITDENTKSEIADAILIMSFPVFEVGEGPGVTASAGRAGETATTRRGSLSSGPGIDDPNPPMSVRVRRIKEASQGQS